MKNEKHTEPTPVESTSPATATTTSESATEVQAPDTGSTSASDTVIGSDTPPVADRPSTVTLTADDLARLIDQAEARGYSRAQSQAAAQPQAEAGMYEEPQSLQPTPSGWKESPLLSSPRQSIWDR